MATFGGFGSTLGTNSTFGATTGGVFGNNAALNKPAAATSSFGLPATAAAPATSFGSFSGFGKPAATTTPAPAFGGFGAPAATTPAPAFGGFGQTTAATAAPSFGTTPGFGTPAAAPAPTFGSFSMANNSLLQQQQTMQQQQQQQQLQLQPPATPIMDAIEKLKRSYAPARNAQGQYTATPEGYRNEECAFKYIALKKKDAQVQNNQALLYGNLLEQAELDNADPDNYLPVEEVGIEALKQRYESQTKELNKAQTQVEKIEEVIQEVNAGNQYVSSKVALLRTRQWELNRRVLDLLRKIEVIRCHHTPLQESERRYRHHLVDLAQRLEQPLKSVQAMAINVALHEQPHDTAATETTALSEEDLQNLVLALKKQSDGLEALTEILRKDTRDIAIIRQATSSAL